MQSRWEKQGDRIEVRVQIPANTTAEIILEGASLAESREGGQALSGVQGILAANETEGGVVVSAGSGAYCFTYPGRQPERS
ncbi:hypothetical protein LJK87_02425 [Paenibacillus sp. P25]|nr:hypothetical protein LJK87_02425 [Paenibacillus sp. P25]